MSRELCIQSTDAPSAFPHTCPVHLFHALVLELYPLTINQKMFSCEPLQQINWTLGGCGGKLWLTAGRWEAQVSTWTCNCCLRWGGWDWALICGIWRYLQVERVRIAWNCYYPAGCGEITIPHPNTHTHTYIQWSEASEMKFSVSRVWRVDKWKHFPDTPLGSPGVLLETGSRGG